MNDSIIANCIRLAEENKQLRENEQALREELSKVIKEAKSFRMKLVRMGVQFKIVGP